MKKFFALALTLALACASVAGLSGCGKRDEQLKIFAPGEYLSPEVKDAFAVWYKEQTGKTIKVVEDNFDKVEEIMPKIEMDKADYDLVLPSDYYVERMIDKNLLLEIDKSKVDAAAVTQSEYAAQAKISDPDLKYSVPYMYGTFGLMYDFSKTEKHLNSWSAIFTDAYKGKSATKASVREAYTSALIYNARQELSDLSNGFADYGDAYGERLRELYSDVSDETVGEARATLLAQSQNILKWDQEDVKYDMAGGSSNIEVALMWSCDAGYVMNDYEDDDGNEHPGNRNLWYVIPEEGGNIYIDSFVIPKYAENVDAAQMYLQFICMKENAILNSEYAGAISTVKTAYDELYEQYTTDTSYAEESGEAWRNMYIEMLFPSDITRKKCGVMRDYGDAEAKVVTMFANVCPVA